MIKLKTTLMLLIFGLISQSAISETSFEPLSYKHARCENISKYFQFETDEILYAGTMYEMHTSVLMDYMINELRILKNMMINAGDLRLNGNSVLCGGIYDDGFQHNAVAMGHDAIKIGKGLVRKIRMSYGNFADSLLNLILFHEFAHSIQSKHGWKYFDKNPVRRSKIKEMQADCMSGVFMKMRNRFDANTVGSFGLFANMVGDKTHGGDHGTPLQRLGALEHGARMYDLNISKKPQIHSYYIMTQLCHQDAMKAIIKAQRL